MLEKNIYKINMFHLPVKVNTTIKKQKKVFITKKYIYT